VTANRKYYVLAVLVPHCVWYLQL